MSLEFHLTAALGANELCDMGKPTRLEFSKLEEGTMVEATTIGRRSGTSIFAISMAVFMVLAGCAWVGFVASPTKRFTGNEIFDLPIQRADILDVIADVGKELGYSVSALDRGAGRIGLSSETPMFTSVLIGKISHATLTLQTQEESRRLGVIINVSGNFGAGDQDVATQLVAEFKEKLFERLRQP